MTKAKVPPIRKINKAVIKLNWNFKSAKRASENTKNNKNCLPNKHENHILKETTDHAVRNQLKYCVAMQIVMSSELIY